MTSTARLSVSEAGRVFVDATAYAHEERFHEAAALLRRESPVHLVDEPGYRPFWAVTRHADVMEVERDNARFLSAPRPLLATEAAEALAIEKGQVLRTLIHMDEPDHKAYRAVAAAWFQPNALKRMEDRMRVLATRFVDHMAELGTECDFARDVAVHYPLYVILSLLGLPESDFDRMLMLTQQLFGGDDEELRRSTDLEEQFTVLLDFFNYFTELTASRRATPTEDLASVLANARLDGEYLPDMDLASYYVIIATAGHDTTSSTIAGGLHALLQHPDELARLQADPELMPTAVEEMIRWVTPVKEFMRTASEDAVVGGTEIAEGQSLYLAYLSANRDEAVFDDPFRFDTGRQPNKHLAFGFGPHFCLGAQLARMETRALFAELLPRLESIELAGTPASSATVFVGGLKTLPIRYRRPRLMPPEGLNRDAYYEAGLDLLADGGHAGLTIAALGDRLGVTKGSFYHHFADMAEYVELLLAHWEAEHATRLIALSESVTDPEERFDLLQGIAVGLPHGAEAAIRAWSWNSAVVAAAQQRVDQARLAHLTSAGLDAGLEPVRARRMAKISMSVLIGMQLLERPASQQSMEDVFAELRQWMAVEDPAAHGR